VASDLVGIFDAVAIVLGAVLPATIYHLAGDIAINWVQVIQTGIISAIIAVCCLRNWALYDTTRMNCFPIEPSRLLGALALAFAAVHGIGVPFAPGARTPGLVRGLAVGELHAHPVWRMTARVVLAMLTAAGTSIRG
jgi:hypothetical protein